MKSQMDYRKMTTKDNKKPSLFADQFLSLLNLEYS